MAPQSVPLVGVMGGIGSGKSSVADAAAKLLRGVRLDADATGHRALQHPAIKRRLVSAFGSGVLDTEGEIIRSRLAAAVFGPEPEALERRLLLNSIVHPWIRCQHLAELHRLALTGAASVVLLDAAVLLEAHWGELCDLLVFVDAPRELRLQRVASRGWDAAELDRREASQLSLMEKRQRADVVITNHGLLEEAAEKLAEVIRTRLLTSHAPQSQFIPRSNLLSPSETLSVTSISQ
jgi:dephospho-CoA kinase